MRLLRKLAVVSFVLLAPLTANATPIGVDYSITDQGNGTYLYDFFFILNNNDGSWTSGQGFDWLIFGDRAGDSLQPSAFGDSGAGNWAWLTSDGSQSYSAFGHEGPTMCFGDVPNCGPDDGLWTPLAVGDSVSGSGLSNILVADGQMYWSIIVGDFTEWNRANRVTAVPEPGTLALFGVGLFGMGLSRRRKKI